MDFHYDYDPYQLVSTDAIVFKIKLVFKLNYLEVVIASFIFLFEKNCAITTSKKLILKTFFILKTITSSKTSW